MTQLVTFHDLRDASIFITGGGSGIGAALTEGFVAQGARVAFVQRSDATEFCDRIEVLHGIRPLFVPCDITNLGALRAAMLKAAENHGPITGLINNAADDARHRTPEVTEEFWDRSQAVNLKAYFFSCQSALPGMIAAGRGAIVNVSSISYIMGNDEYISYATANAGITGMTRSLAREFGPNNVRVNALAPGWVLTEKQQNGPATPEALATHLQRQCLKEHLQPDDMVDTTLFLISDASRMMTGQVIAVDGGVVATG